MPTWTFITNHGAVLALVARHGHVTAREIAVEVGITERSVLRAISELEAGGYLERRRDGRVNRYQVNHDLPLRRPERRNVAVRELLKFLVGDRSGGEGEGPSGPESACQHDEGDPKRPGDGEGGG